jgi:hypothetical protein
MPAPFPLPLLKLDVYCDRPSVGKLRQVVDERLPGTPCLFSIEGFLSGLA